MKVWFRHQREAFGRAFKRFRQNPLVTLVSVLVIGVTLALPVGLYLALLNLHSITGRINAEPQIGLFLTVAASDADAKVIETALKANRAIAEFKFISKDDALIEMRAAAGLGDVVEALDRNPLPHAFVIRGKSSDPAALEVLRDELVKLPKVEHVRLDSAWAKRLAALSDAGKKIILILGVALGAALLAVTGNTIRLQILTQREEIEVGRLIGATNGYLRRPYLYFGAVQGLLGGVLGLALAISALVWLSANATDLIRMYAPDFRPEALSWGISAAIIGSATLLGWLGAYTSVSLYLRQINPR
jgi:cell division transport system permease protein